MTSSSPTRRPAAGKARAFSVTGKSWVDSRTHVVRFQELDTQKFVALYLNSTSLAPYVSGTPRPALHQKPLNKIRIPLPPLDQQREIVAKLERFSVAAEHLRSLYRDQLARLAELKQSLLSKALAAELACGTEDAARVAQGGRS
jgi:type I restriction enzyme S subunit